MSASESLQLPGRTRHPESLLGTALTGFAAALLLLTLAVILGTVILQGLPSLSWRFVSTAPRRDFFDPQSAAVLPMIIGTTIRVLVMTVFVMPVGVITAVYLTEYARAGSPYTRAVRVAINNLAGVPSIVSDSSGLVFSSTLWDAESILSRVRWDRIGGSHRSSGRR